MFSVSEMSQLGNWEFAELSLSYEPSVTTLGYQELTEWYLEAFLKISNKHATQNELSKTPLRIQVSKSKKEKN